MMVYSKLATDTVPFYRIWDGTAWGAEASATAVSANIQYIVLKFSRTRDEAILGTLDATGDIRTQIWNGTSWSATTLHANVGTTNDAYRGFDIEYETSGDRAVIVYNNANSADPSYNIWNGTSWAGAVAITAPPTTGAPFWIEIAPNPLSASNDIAMILLDANVDVYGMTWNGTAWGTMGVTTVWDATAAIATKKAIDVAYEQTSGESMFMWGDATATDVYYRTWNGTTLLGVTLLDIAAAGIVQWVSLVADHSSGSNKLMYGGQDAGADLNTRQWNGTAWDTATEHPEHDAGVENILSMNFDLVYETYSANAGKAWIAWGDAGAVSRKQWSGTAWGAATTAGDDTSYVTLHANPTSGAVFMGVYQSSTSASDDILEAHLTGGGTTWSTNATIWGGSVVVDPVMFRIAIASDRYTPPVTILGNGASEPTTQTIAPGAGATDLDNFTLQATISTDTVTAITVTLLPAGAYNNIAQVDITDTTNAAQCTAVTGLTSNTVTFPASTCTIPVTTTETTYKVRITPKTHGNMDSPATGVSYNTTGTVTSFTSTNVQTGSDTGSATITVDNLSPNGATATSGTAGDAKVTLNWITSSSSDFDTTNGSVILRWAAASAGAEVPAEGNNTYTAGNTITTATVACVISSAVSASLSKIDGSGGDAGCTTTALTNGQQYTYKVFQRDTNGNYDVGVSIGTFTPAAAPTLTFTVDTGSVFIGTVTAGTPISSSTVLTVNTNNATGYNIQVIRASTTPTLFLSSQTIPDTPNNNNWTAPAATSTAGPSAIWTSGTTNGLGFRVKQTGTVSNTYSSIWWGIDDTGANAKYSGIATSTATVVQSMIAKTTLGSATNEKTVVEYKLDVSGTQASGSYNSSPITFTAVANP